MSNWTDELREQAKELYLDAEPTPETSQEIIQDIADELGFTVNGVRIVLSRLGVFVAKTPAKAKTSGGGGTRVNKQAAIDSLKTAIEEAGHEVDDSIVDKLTGKAAVYFAGLLK